MSHLLGFELCILQMSLCGFRTGEGNPAKLPVINITLTKHLGSSEIPAPDGSQDVMSQVEDITLDNSQSTLSIHGCGPQLPGTHRVQEFLTTQGVNADTKLCQFLNSINALQMQLLVNIQYIKPHQTYSVEETDTHSM